MEKYTKHVPWVVDNFPFISGIVLLLWWSLVRIKRSLFSGYPTNQQMDERMAANTELICIKMDENNLRLQQDIQALTDSQADHAATQAEESIAMRDLLIAHIDKHE